MVLDAALLNTQHYIVRIKGKMKHRRLLHLSVVAIEKGAFGSPSIKFANNCTFNIINSIKFQYLKPFNCVQTINRNTGSHLTKCKQ